jgi:hypothetical protein
MTPPRHETDTEHMREIARDEADGAVKLKVSEHNNRCAQEGHTAALWQAINELRGKYTTMATQHAEERGELRGAVKAETRQLKIIVAVVGGLGLAAQVVGMLLRARGL